MATRGSLGGLAAATREVADVLDAFGLDRVLIETVGVGQSELDIARTADTSVVVLVPESGDSIQTLKAGLMEIADVFVVNKADRPGADRLRNELELMLGLRQGATMRNVPAHHGVDLSMNPMRAARAAAREENPDHWTSPVLRTVASQGEGIAEVIAATDRHRAILRRAGSWARAAGLGCAIASKTSLKCESGAASGRTPTRMRGWTASFRRSKPARRIRSPWRTNCWRAARTF